MAKLSDDEVRRAVAERPGWEPAGDAIRKEFAFPTFRDAVAFLVRLSYEAEATNHHPDVDLRYNRLTIALSTHSEGGVTAKDLELASAIDELGAPGA